MKLNSANLTKVKRKIQDSDKTFLKYFCSEYTFRTTYLYFIFVKRFFNFFFDKKNVLRPIGAVQPVIGPTECRNLAAVQKGKKSESVHIYTINIILYKYIPT